MDVEKFKIALAEEIEKLAKKNAIETGFDYVTAPHGLARAIMVVFSDKEILAEAIRRAKEVSGDQSTE